MTRQIEILSRLRTNIQNSTLVLQGMISACEIAKDSLSIPGLKKAVLLIPGETSNVNDQKSTCNERQEKFFQRLDQKYVLKVFNQYATDGVLQKSDLGPALIELGVMVKDNGFDNLYRLLDLNRDGTLEFEEFQRALACSSEIEQWAASLPLSGLLASCLPEIKGGDGDATRQLCMLSPQEIEVSLNRFAICAKRLIMERLKELEKGFDELDRRAKVQESPVTEAGKFSSAGMEWGTIEDFHKGMQGRIGAYLRPWCFCRPAPFTAPACIPPHSLCSPRVLIEGLCVDMGSSPSDRTDPGPPARLPQPKHHGGHPGRALRHVRR